MSIDEIAGTLNTPLFAGNVLCVVWSAVIDQIISNASRSPFSVLNYDQSDHHAYSMSFIIIMKDAWSAHQGVT